MANANNKVYYNRGYLFRKKDDPVGVSGECNTLELYVYDVKNKTTRTGDEIIELSCSGNFNKNNGIDYVLGDDVYTDKEKGLLFITCSAWDIKKDRLKKLNIRKGFVLLIHGKFERQEYTRQDNSKGVSVVCKNIKNFDVLKFPNDGQTATPASATQPAQEAPAPAPATSTMNAPVAPQTPVGNTAPVDASDVQVPF